MAGKTKTGQWAGKLRASTRRAAAQGARRAHVPDLAARGRLGRRHVNAACGAGGAGRGAR